MKSKIIWLFLGLAGLALVLPTAAYAQTNNSNQSRSDQILNELLNEVRLLRQDVRRLYSSQTMVERLKVQQDQVNRLSAELNAVRSDMATTKSAKVELAERIASLQRNVDAGVISPTELNALKAKLSDLDQREPDLATRESQLSGLLNRERSSLKESQKKLDAILLELQTLDEDEKPPKRRP